MKMKKLLALLLSVLLVVSVFTACGGDEEYAEDEEYYEEEAPAEDEYADEEYAEEEAPADEEYAEEEAPAEDEYAEEEAPAEEASYIDVPVVVVNGTGTDLTELYCSGAGLETWGTNIIPEGKYVPHGNYLELTFRVDANNVAWDIAAVSSEGQQFTVYDLDISQMPTAGFFMELVVDGDTVTGYAVPSIDLLQGDYAPAE